MMIVLNYNPQNTVKKKKKENPMSSYRYKSMIEQLMKRKRNKFSLQKNSN